jgi:peptidoglycan hydrolase-like protein with peptidoglycan-binding domain
MKRKKIISGFLGIAMILTMSIGVAPQVQAQTATTVTIESLQALIIQLQAQLAALIAGTPTTGGVVGVTPGFLFTRNLTIGSTGQDVVELQRYLVASGYLVIPVNVPYGYFGPLTRAAVGRWQAAMGISPTAGYFGPISRTRLNALIVTVPTVPGTPTTPTNPNGDITTPGVEGTLSVSLNPTPSSGATIREGDREVAVMGLKLEARRSDIRIERIQVELPNSSFYNNISNKVYVSDGNTILASADLNNSTVVREGSRYFVNITGLRYVVPKDSTRVLTLRLDVYNSVDSTYENTTIDITVPANGVRGIDGAGIFQYGPSSSISRSFRVDGSLADDASLKLSLSSNSPRATDVVASEGSSSNELNGLTVLKFNLRAERDNVLVTDLTANINGSGPATSTTAFLYDGNTIIGSANVTNGVAQFTNIDFTVNKDSTKELTLKVDMRSATSVAGTVYATISASGITAENSFGEAVDGGSLSGSATGETLTVRNMGPVFSLVSRSITKSQTPQQNNTSTSTANADFNIRVKAVGGDVIFGTQASTTPMVVFGIYKGSALQSYATLPVASSTSLTIPSGAITSGIGTNSFKITENNEVTIPVSFLFEGRTTDGALVPVGSYSVGIEAIQWTTNNGATIQTSTFMAGEPEWRTSTISLP